VLYVSGFGYPGGYPKTHRVGLFKKIRVFKTLMCLLDTLVSPAKMAEPIRVLFGARTSEMQGAVY